MPPHPLVRRSNRLRSPPPRVLRRSQWLSLSSNRQPATKLSHNERTKADWPLPKRGALFLLRGRPFGCALERDWIQTSTYSFVNAAVTAAKPRLEQARVADAPRD